MPTAGPPLARRDVVITVLLALLSVVNVGWSDPGAPHVAAAVAAPLFVLPVLWRRRRPLEVSGATLLLIGAHIVAFGELTRCGVAIPLLLVEAFASGSRLPHRTALLALATSLVTSVVMLVPDTSAGLGGLSVAVPLTLVVWVIGRVTRSRTALAAQLAEHNVALRDARETNARLEVATDRARLAGELDDLLRSRVAELADLAEAGAGGDADAAFRRIETESRATLDQMRAVVGTLRGDGPAQTEPQPTLTHLDALLLRAKGRDATLEVVGSPRTLPPGLELSAYRVVEHLLGATEDAPGVEVRVDFAAEALEVRVSGPRRRRADAAISRARERVALHHGRLQEESRDGRHVVTAAFPVLAAV